MIPLKYPESNVDSQAPGESFMVTQGHRTSPVDSHASSACRWGDQMEKPWEYHRKTFGKWGVHGSLMGFTLWCHQTWLENSPVIGGFERKIAYFYGPFSSKPCLSTGGYLKKTGWFLLKIGSSENQVLDSSSKQVWAMKKIVPASADRMHHLVLLSLIQPRRDSQT